MLQDWFNKISLFVIVVIAFLDGLLVATEWKENNPNASAIEPVILENILEQKSSSISPEVTPVQDPPFTSQAPYGIWDSPWAYFAEEACSLMASAWNKGEALNDPAASLLSLRDWENAELGTFKDTDLDQTLRILKEYFNLQAELSYDVSMEALIQSLDQGKILLVPVNGQVLANPYYGKPGPEHHMVLIFAYEGEKFLAHDPGTTSGERSLYLIEKILESIQDLNGEGRVIVISR